MDRIPPWDLLVDDVLLIVVVAQDFLAAVLLRQRTELGRALSRYLFAMGLAFLGALLMPLWPELFAGNVWRWGIRAAIITAASLALHQIVRAFGGWRATAAMLWLLYERAIRGRPPRRWVSPHAPIALALGAAIVLVLAVVLALLT